MRASENVGHVLYAREWRERKGGGVRGAAARAHLVGRALGKEVFVGGEEVVDVAGLALGGGVVIEQREH